MSRRKRGRTALFLEPLAQRGLVLVVMLDMHRSATVRKPGGFDGIVRPTLGVPAVLATQHASTAIARGTGRIELASPGNPAFGIAGGSMQPSAGIQRPVMRGRLIPVPPAFGLDMRAQPAVDQHGLGPLAPRTAQINRAGLHIVRRREGATVKHKAIRLALGRRGRRNVSVHVHGAVERTNLAALKIGPRTAKDKVDVAGNEAATEVLPPHAARGKLFGAYKAARLDLARRQRPQKERVLMAQDAAGIDHQAIAVGIQGNPLAGLATVTGVVFDCQARKRHIVGIDQHRIRTKGAEPSILAATVFRRHLGTQAAHDTHAVGRLALDGHMRTTNLNPLAVLTRRHQHTHRHARIGNALPSRLERRRNAAIRTPTFERNLKKLFFITHSHYAFCRRRLAM